MSYKRITLLWKVIIFYYQCSVFCAVPRLLPAAKWPVSFLIHCELQLTGACARAPPCVQAANLLNSNIFQQQQTKEEWCHVSCLVCVAAMWLPRHAIVSVCCAVSCLPASASSARCSDAQRCGRIEYTVPGEVTNAHLISELHQWQHRGWQLSHLLKCLVNSVTDCYIDNNIYNCSI